MTSMPSPSSCMSVGDPTVSTQTTCVRSTGSDGKCRAANACMPSMNDSSEPVETSSTRTPATGSAASVRARPSTVATPVRLSLAPGTVEREPISTIVAAVPSESSPPRRRSTRGAEQPAEGDEQRPADDREHHGGGRVRPLDAGPGTGARRTAGRAVRRAGSSARRRGGRRRRPCARRPRRRPRRRRSRSGAAAARRAGTTAARRRRRRRCPRPPRPRRARRTQRRRLSEASPPPSASSPSGHQ